MQELPFECRPIQEGSSLLIRGFPSGAKPYEEVLTFLRKGTMLQKYGRHGQPKYHYFRLGAEDTQLQWESKNGRIRCVQLHRMRQFQRGQETDVFRRRPQPLKAFLSFSILYLDDKRHERSLDVICLNHGDFEMWYWGIQVVRSYPPSHFYAFMAQRNIVEEPKKPSIPPQIQVEVTRSQETATSTNLSSTSSPNIATPCPLPPAPESAPMVLPPNTTRAPTSQAGPESAGVVRNSTGTIVLGSAHGSKANTMKASKASAPALGSGADAVAKAGTVSKAGTAQSGKAPWWDFPSALHMGVGLIGKREIGDLYVWGSLAQAEQTDTHVSGLGQQPDPGPCVTVDPMREWQQTHLPELVRDTGSVDVVLSACGTRHAALVSRAGELYTWGYGKDGNLGHGSLKSLSSPRRVLGGWVPKGEGVRGLSCSDGCTAAVTSDGSLYTWGRGLSGQLGHGDCYPCAIPKRVVFEPSLNCAPVARVVRVSVGPTHTAAITADGRLYTWGDGQFGQLGHGSTSPEYHPRQVEALEGMFVTAVACGWWHTAAVAYGCPDGDGNGGHPSGGNTQVATWAADEGEEEVHDLVHQQQHHDQPLAQQAAQPHALQQEGSDSVRSAAANHPMPSPFLSRSGRILGPSREQQGLDESQGRGSLDTQHRESPKSAERGGEENASVGASSNAEGGADGAQGGGRLWRRRADLAQINAGGLSEKESDSSRLGKLHTRRGGLSSKGSRSPSRSPREGLWGDISLPGKRTVSFQDEVDDGLSHQRRSNSFSPASSPQLAPTPTRESPLRHSSELFVWKSDVQPAVQRQGNGPERAKGAVSPNAAFPELPQPANPQQPAHRASAPPGGGYGHEPHIGAGGRRSGDSAGSFEGHGDTQHVGGSGRRGGWGAGEMQQLQQRLHHHHQNQQQQQQQRPPQVMADALQEGLFSESASLLLAANNDVEHACRSSAPTRTSAPNALIGKNNRPVTVAGMASLSGNLASARDMEGRKLSAPPAHYYSRPSTTNFSVNNSMVGGGAAGVHGAGVLFTWGGMYGWVEPKDVREAAAQKQQQQKQQQQEQQQQEQQQQQQQEQHAGVPDSKRPSQDGPPASCFSVDGDEDSKRSSPHLLDTHAWANAPPSPPMPMKHDHHGGCLGTGDKEGRLLPTRVCGELEEQEVAQVACGLNLTVVVTRSGKVYQMGGTGAQTQQAKRAAWEGCTSPTLVDANLRCLFVEQVAAGMHHVAVIASPLTPHGKISEERRRSRLLTWGRGTAGQLGHELAKDCNIPQVVAAVEGRRIMHVASGGNHTFAICEHNPLDHARRATQHHHDKLSQQPLVPPKMTVPISQPSLTTTSSRPQLQKSMSARRISTASPIAPLVNSQQLLSSLPSALQSLGHPGNALSASVPALHHAHSFGSRAAHQAATASGALGSLLAQSLGLSSDKSDKASALSTSGGSSALERSHHCSTPSGRPPTGMLHSMGAAAVSAVAAVTPFRDSWGAGSLDASKLKEKLAAREKRSTHSGILNEGPASKVVVGIPSQDHPTLAGRQGADFKASLRHSRQHRRLSRMRSRSRASASSARLAMARSQSQRHTTSGGSLFGDTDSPKLNHSKSLSHKGQQGHQLEEQQKQLQRALTTGSNSEGSADLGEGTDAGAVCWERTDQKTGSRLGNSNSAWEKASEKSDDEALQVASRMQSAHEPQLLGLDSDPLPAKAWSTEAEALENALDSALPENEDASKAQSKEPSATQCAVPPPNLELPNPLGPQHSESDSLSGYTSSTLASPHTSSATHAQHFRIVGPARPMSAPAKTSSEQQKQLQQQQLQQEQRSAGTSTGPSRLSASHYQQYLRQQQQQRQQNAASELRQHLHQQPHQQQQQQQQQLPTESLLGAALNQQHRHQQQWQQHSKPPSAPASPVYSYSSARASEERHREPLPGTTAAAPGLDPQHLQPDLPCATSDSTAQPTQPNRQDQQQASLPPLLPGSLKPSTLPNPEQPQERDPAAGAGHAALELQGSQLQASDGSAHLFFDNSLHTYDDDDNSKHSSFPNFALLQPPSLLDTCGSPREPPKSRTHPSEDDEGPSFEASGVRSSSFMLSGFPSSQVPKNEQSRGRLFNSTSPSHPHPSSPPPLPNRTSSSQTSHGPHTNAHPHPQPQLQSPIAKRGMHGRHHTRSATLANWAELTIVPPSPQHALLHSTNSSSLPHREPSPAIPDSTSAIAPTAPERGAQGAQPIHLAAGDFASTAQTQPNHLPQPIHSPQPTGHPQPIYLALGARAESARWYDNHAAVSDGEESSPWAGCLSPQTHGDARGLMVTNPLSLNPLKVPSRGGSGPLSRRSWDGCSDTDTKTAHNSSRSTPRRAASGVLPRDIWPGPEGGVAHAPADTVQQQQQQQQQQEHAHVLLQGQHSHVSLSPSITEVSLQPRSNVHRYGGASDDVTSSPSTTPSTSIQHTNSLPGSSIRSHSLENSQTPSSASVSPFAQSNSTTPNSLFAPRVAHQAAHAAAALHAQPPSPSHAAHQAAHAAAALPAQPPTPPRIFDLSSLGASNAAHGSDSHSRSMSAGGVRASSPPAASDHRSPDHGANALDHMPRTESGSKSRGGSPFQPLPTLTAPGMEEAGGSYAEESPSPSSQPLLVAGSGRRMVGVPTLSGRSSLSGPRAHSRSRSVSVTPPPLGSRDSSAQRPPPLRLATRGGSLRQRLSFSAEEGNQSDSETQQQHQQLQNTEAEVSAGTQRVPRSSSSMKHRLGLTAEERASTDLQQQRSYPGGEGLTFVNGRQSSEGGVSPRKGRLAGRIVEEGTSPPTPSRSQLDLQRGRQGHQQQQQQQRHHGQQTLEPPVQHQVVQPDQQNPRGSLESLPSGSHQRIQLLQQSSMNNSGSDSRNTSGSLLQEGDVANHPFASTFSVEVPQPCAPDLHATLDTPEQHSMHTAAQCKPQLDNAATDTAGAHIMQWQLPVQQQQQQQQQQQEGGSIDADSVPPAYNPTPASPFHAWGLSSAAAGALTSSPSLQEVNQQHQSHHNHLHQQLPQHGSGSRDDSGDTVGSDDGNGAGSVVLGEESSERELWRWAQDSPTRNASHTGGVDPSVHCGCGSSACVCDPAAEEAEHTQASPSLPLLPTMGSTAAQGKKKGAVTSPQTLLRGHSDAALALEGAAAPAPPITHNSTRLQGGESPQSNQQTASLTHHHHTPLYPPPLSATQPAHAGTTHSNIDATGGNTEGAAAQQPAPPPAAASPFDVAGVVQAVGPAMLRTKAGSMLAKAHRRTRSTEAQSMEAVGALALTPAPSMPQRHTYLPSLQHLPGLQQQLPLTQQQQQQQQQAGVGAAPLGATSHLRSYNSASLPSPSFYSSQPCTPSTAFMPSPSRPPLPLTAISSHPTPTDRAQAANSGLSADGPPRTQAPPLTQTPLPHTPQPPTAATSAFANPPPSSSSPARGHPAHPLPPSQPNTPAVTPLQLPLPPANPPSPASRGSHTEHASSPSLAFPPTHAVGEEDSAPQDLLAALPQLHAIPPARRGRFAGSAAAAAAGEPRGSSLRSNRARP